MLANLVTSERQVVADFEEDMEVLSASIAGISVHSKDLTKWREEWIRLKWQSLDTHATMISWDKSVHPSSASYGLTWTPGAVALHRDSVFVFAASQSNEDTKPFGWTQPTGEAEEHPENEDKRKEPGLDWTLVVSDVEGNEARLALSRDSRLYPQVKSSKRKFDGLAFTANSEIVWRRFEFPVRDFLGANPNLEAATITRLRFEFDRSEAGSIVLDDIGVE